MSPAPDFEANIVQPPPHAWLYDVVVRGDQWLAVGDAGPSGSVLLMRGSASSSQTTTRVLPSPNPRVARGLADLGAGRSVIVGEAAVPGSVGLFGHSLYRGLWLEIDGEGKPGQPSMHGAVGVTGFDDVVRVGDRLIVGGETEFQVWIQGRRLDGAVLWDIKWPEVDTVKSMAANDAGVAVLADGPINMPSTHLVRLIDTNGQPIWTWRRSGVGHGLMAIAAAPRGGFVVAGAFQKQLKGSNQQPMIVALARDGTERWSREFDVGGWGGRIFSVAVGPSGEILTVERRSGYDDGGWDHYNTSWVRVVSASGEPLDEARRLDAVGGYIGASVALLDGWLVVGGRRIGGSPMRACVWRLDRHGRVLWTAEAEPQSAWDGRSFKILVGAARQ